MSGGEASAAANGGDTVIVAIDGSSNSDEAFECEYLEFEPEYSACYVIDLFIMVCSSVKVCLQSIFYMCAVLKNKGP